MRFTAEAALALLAILCGLVVVSTGSAGGEPADVEVHGDGADAGLHVRRREVALGRAREDRPGAARPHRLEAGQRDDQVRLRRDRVVHGRRRRPRGDQPGRHGQDAEGEQGGRAGVRAAHREASRARSHAAVKKAVPGAEIGTPSSRRTAASRPRCPRTRSRDLLKVAGVAAVQKDTLEQPQDDNTGVHRRHERVAVARRLGQRRLERDRRRHRHRHLAGASDARRPRPLGAGRRPQGLRVRRRQRRRPPRADVRVQQQADRRVRVHEPRTWRTSAPAPTSTATTRPRVLGARLRGSRHAHADDGRRRLRRLGRALRRPARPGLRHRTRRARDHVPRLPRGRAASAPTRSRRCSRRSSTAST